MTPLMLRKQSGAQIFTYVARPNIMAGVSRETELCMQKQRLNRNDDTADLFHVKQVYRKQGAVRKPTFPIREADAFPVPRETNRSGLHRIKRMACFIPSFV